MDGEDGNSSVASTEHSSVQGSASHTTQSGAHGVARRGRASPTRNHNNNNTGGTNVHGVHAIHGMRSGGSSVSGSNNNVKKKRAKKEKVEQEPQEGTYCCDSV